MLTRRKFLGASLAAAAVAPRLLSQPLEKLLLPKNPVSLGNNEFALEMHRQFAGKAGNVFASPFSMEAALAMTSLGAKGDTYDQMHTALHLPKASAEWAPIFKRLLTELNDENRAAEKRGYEIRIANALWGSSAYPWNKDYLKSMSDTFGAGLIETDFSQPGPARVKINDWVAAQTKDKIKDLLPDGSITQLTRLVLTNAIYFKGKWEAEFDKKLTKDLPFTAADGKKQTVPMMFKDGHYRYAERPGYKSVEMIYKGNELSMIAILPEKADGMAEVEKSLTGKEFAELRNQLAYSQPVKLWLPRFKVETSYDLTPPLQALGIKDAFVEGKADFSGMHTGQEKLYITAAVHKAFVEVNEEGTEAAAATGVVVGVKSLPPKAKEFKADRPFLFAITHMPTNTILFFGKVESIK